MLCCVKSWYKDPYHFHLWHESFPNLPPVRPCRGSDANSHLCAGFRLGFPISCVWPFGPSSGAAKIIRYPPANTNSSAHPTCFLPTFEESQHLVRPCIGKLCLKCFIRRFSVVFNKRISLKVQSALCPAISVQLRDHRSLLPRRRQP